MPAAAASMPRSPPQQQRCASPMERRTRCWRTTSAIDSVSIAEAPRSSSRNSDPDRGLPGIGALGERASLVGGRRVAAGADHHAVLELIDDVALVAGVEE